MDKDEVWTSDEYGESHVGRVGTLLEDGSSPKPVYFDSNSCAFGWEVRHWSVYDGGTYPRRPQAHALHGECSCGWRGEPRIVDRSTAGDLPLHEYGWDAAAASQDDWDRHIMAVEATTVPLPAELETLLQDVAEAIERLGHDTPIAALKAARSMELIAGRTAYQPAHDARKLDPKQVATALGLNVDGSRALLARFGNWDYHG
ncbi:hypothetical protein [Streptomyces sp. RerS4]|uniref:hypothetical protein n=1 Tax=Streptomyces sp. RerS4 TaxID=2942449 RepID=UPI00201C8404|nr:hypothetical protein [Streptomyces sp. RerS4]UQW99104.1 hypothetical protein M4D82_00030 [Streptomyces sp. RerS4]